MISWLLVLWSFTTLNLRKIGGIPMLVIEIKFCNYSAIQMNFVLTVTSRGF